MAQIKEAGHSLFSIQSVQVEPEKIHRKKMGPVDICLVCGGAYPTHDGDQCRSCQDNTSYKNVVAVNAKK